MKEIEEDKVEVGYQNNYDLIPAKRNGSKSHPEMFVDKVTGWNQFPDEVAWFLYDFFKYELTGYEKIIFYSYYMNGMTLQEIASAFDCSFEKKTGEWVYRDCSFQFIGIQIKKIEKKLGYRWKNKHLWTINKTDK